MNASYLALLLLIQTQGGSGLVVLHQGGESERYAHELLQRLDSEGINFAREPALLDLRLLEQVPRIWQVPSDGWRYTAYLGIVKKYRRNGRTIGTGLLPSTRPTEEIMRWWAVNQRRDSRPLAWDMYDNAPK